MRLLLHPVDRHATPIALLVSLATHVAVIAGVMAAAREPRIPSEQVEAFVRFFLPPDRLSGSGARARAAWATPPADAVPEGAGRAAPLGSGPVEALGGDTAAMRPQTTPGEAEAVLTEVEVDTPVERLPGSAAPIYPGELLQQGVEGSVSVTYVVDTLGLADSLSIRVMAAANPAFVDAVREVLPRMRFRPALLGGVKVRQLVQQTFSFRIRRQEEGTPPPPLTLRQDPPRPLGP